MGSERRTASVPTMPPELARFSTTTGWPSDFAMESARWRATTSVGPPAENGTMSVTGRCGNSWANAAAQAATVRMSAEMRFMSLSPL